MEELAQFIKNFAEIHIALAPLLYILFRTFSVIFPPFPGTTLDLIAIPLFGKVMGFVYAEITMVLGATINFYIARYLGKPFILKFTSVKKIEEWEKRIEEKSGFWGLVGIRLLTISIYDYLSYIAGLTKMKTSKFFWSSLVASIPPTAAFFYIGGFILNRDIEAITFIVPVVIAIILIRDKIITEDMKNGIKKFFSYKDGETEV
ncbi:hypothetical protein COV42_02285 [Candidatus Campbellbacteria bacterium CG11_big_fil_rev_8_21_14_0_20_44_21]|nr:MAG: hypothetical protein COV42_02285 [Candidatus Campbellbacteria bacterium CG11_big_fil_rev_8_21_14_0_20_44_21]